MKHLNLFALPAMATIAAFFLYLMVLLVTAAVTSPARGATGDPTDSPNKVHRHQIVVVLYPAADPEKRTSFVYTHRDFPSKDACMEHMDTDEFRQSVFQLALRAQMEVQGPVGIAMQCQPAGVPS